MYSFKEKQKHFSELQNPDAASLDLKLLTQKSPLHPHLRKFSRNPQRYANEILYQLLDVAQRDEIRNNRRLSTSESPASEQQDKISDATNQIVEAEERAEEAEERAEEAELRAEEAEERADNAEAILEQEKKKVVTTPNPKVKSKSGKNTRKSTGTTSRIRKSRQPRSSTTTGS